MRISDWSSDVCSSDLEDRVAAAQRLGDVADAARRQRHHVALGDKDGGAIAFEADGFAAAGVHVGSWACGVAVRRVASARTAGTPRMVADRKSVVEGKSGSGRVDVGGRRRVKKKKDIYNQQLKE